MLKVLHVITGLPVGGAELMLARLTARMDRARTQSLVVAITPGPVAANIAENGTPVFCLGIRRGVPDPRALVRLCSIIDREKPDVIQTWLYHADLLGLVAGKFKGVGALSWNLRGSQIPDRDSSLLLAATRRVLASLSSIPDVVVINSEAGKADHEKRGYRPRRWALIPNGFDTNQFRPDAESSARWRASLGIASTAPVIGIVARFHPMKDHRTFFQAARLFSAGCPDARFIAAGPGMDEGNPQLQKLLADAGVDRTKCHLLGMQHAVESLLPAFDVFSLSSAYGEGFPNAVGEAMATGVPCVATDTGDARWLIGETGLVVPPRSPEALSHAWSTLWRNGAEARQSLGARARQRIESAFTLDRIVGLYDDLFAELGDIARRRRSGGNRV